MAAAASAPAGAAAAPPAPAAPGPDTGPATEPSPAGACGAGRKPLSESRGLLAVPELESSSKGSSGSAPGDAPVKPARKPAQLAALRQRRAKHGRVCSCGVVTNRHYQGMDQGTIL